MTKQQLQQERAKNLALLQNTANTNPVAKNEGLKVTNTKYLKP